MQSETAVIATSPSSTTWPTGCTERFMITGRAEGEACALTRITPRTAVMDYGDKRVCRCHHGARNRRGHLPRN